MTAAYVTTATCCPECAAPQRAHHDRLLSVDVDVEELLGLLELAVTWHELDYSREHVVGPAGWASFAQRHEWRHPERAERAFSLALDIVGRAPCSAPPPADVLRLVRC